MINLGISLNNIAFSVKSKKSIISYITKEGQIKPDFIGFQGSIEIIDGDANIVANCNDINIKVDEICYITDKDRKKCIWDCEENGISDLIDFINEYLK
jgi:hypothetical protein